MTTNLFFTHTSHSLARKGGEKMKFVSPACAVPLKGRWICLDAIWNKQPCERKKKKKQKQPAQHLLCKLNKLGHLSCFVWSIAYGKMVQLMHSVPSVFHFWKLICSFPSPSPSWWRISLISGLLAVHLSAGESARWECSLWVSAEPASQHGAWGHSGAWAAII